MLRRLSGLLMLAFLAVVLVACEGSTANIQSATLSHGFADNKATDNVTTFAPGDTFHLVVQLANAPDDTKVKAVWTAVDVGGGTIKDQKIDEKELSTGSAPIDFTLAPNNPFPAGKYKVDLYLNSKLDRTLEFQVQ